MQKKSTPDSASRVSRMMKIGLTVLLIYIAYCGLLFVLQRQMMFPRGMAGPVAAHAPDKPGIESIWLPTSFGKVEAWLLAPSSPPVKPWPLVIFGHGNAEVIDLWPGEFSRFTRMGIGLLLVEYPGYGRSQGRPTQRTIGETFVSAYDQMVQRPEVDAQRIILMGRSLGGGAICQLATQRPSAAMILMSSFTSARSFARRYFAPGFLVLDPFDNLSVVAQYPAPLLIIHGRHDDLIPFSHAKALHQAAAHSELIAYQCAHNDCPPDGKVFWKDISRFLAQAGLLPSTPPQG